MANKKERRAEFKDHKRAAAAAAQRRRRLMQAGGILVVVLVLGAVVGTVLLSGDDEKKGPKPAATTDADIACGGDKPPEADPQEYDEPEQVLEDGVDYSAVVSTSCGTITIDLLESDAPETVNSFVFLAEEGYFDGLLWHRIVADFVIQTGDPNGLNGTPPDGPGYTIPDELPTGENRYVLGTVAMANSGPNSGGSQWFVVTSQTAGLTNDYAIFGETDEANHQVLAKLSQLPTTQEEIPEPPAYINSIEIVEK